MSGILSFIIIVAGGELIGWKFAIAAPIFILSLAPRRYEYVLPAGPFLDLFLGFPGGFFTVIFLGLALTAGLTSGFLKEENWISLAARIFFLAAFAFLGLLILFESTVSAGLGANFYHALGAGAKFFSTALLFLFIYKTADFYGWKKIIPGRA